MPLDVPPEPPSGPSGDAWVTVSIPRRHAFMEFVEHLARVKSLPELVQLQRVKHVSVTYTVASTEVRFLVGNCLDEIQVFANLLWTAIEPGETIKIGNSAWTKEAAGRHWTWTGR